MLDLNSAWFPAPFTLEAEAIAIYSPFIGQLRTVLVLTVAKQLSMSGIKQYARSKFVLAEEQIDLFRNGETGSQTG